jgi:hypothetical protein
MVAVLDLAESRTAVEANGIAVVAHFVRIEDAIATDPLCGNGSTLASVPIGNSAATERRTACSSGVVRAAVNITAADIQSVCCASPRAQRDTDHNCNRISFHEDLHGLVMRSTTA